MNVFSNSSLTSAETLASTGSSLVSSGAPPRSSSQFALQRTLVGSPVISDNGRATGVCSCSGALVRFS